MSDLQYYGYHSRSRQPCILHRLKIKLDDVLEFDNIDKWLGEHFNIDRDIYALSSHKLEDVQGAAVVAAARRALALYSEFLRACEVPCFDFGQIINIDTLEEETDTFVITVALPVIDNLPVVLFEQLFRRTLNLVVNGLRLEPVLGAVDALFTQIDDSIFSTIKKTVPFGTSTLEICKLVFQQDIPFRHIGGGIMQLGWGAKSKLLYDSFAEGDSFIGVRICADKYLTAKILTMADLPTPPHFLVNTFEAAVEAARELGWPVVVKPSDAERSEGVTTNIRGEKALRKGYNLASSRSGRILVERHVAGVCHRITVAGDNVVYVVRRHPKGLSGNGQNTVSELVAMANAEQAILSPWKRLKKFPLDDLALECLADVGLASNSIPDDGQWFPLRPLPSGEWGGVIDDLTSQIHPDNVRLALEVTRILGLTMAGIDLMTVDISRPWYENNAVINEINARPQILMRDRSAREASFISTLVDGDGRIPIHLVTGEGDLLGKAKELKRRFEKSGRKCYLTSGDHTEDCSGENMAMGASTLFSRSIALLMRRDVHELILVGERRELSEGLAIDRLTSAFIVGESAARRKQTIGYIRTMVPVQSWQEMGT